MEYLQNLLDQSTLPIVSAFLLGLLTAVSPCPLATNITAIGFISQDIDNRNRIFTGGMLYTLGRIIAYTLLGGVFIAILREGASLFQLQKAVSGIGEMLIAPMLIGIGLFMLFGHRLNLPQLGFTSGGERLKQRGGWGALLLGMLFAMAFCPSSGFFFFGMLIPMAASLSGGGYLLPLVFGIATALPVVVVAWLLAYSVAGVGRFYNRITLFERYFRKGVAILFIAVGCYYAFLFIG